MATTSETMRSEAAVLSETQTKTLAAFVRGGDWIPVVTGRGGQIDVVLGGGYPVSMPRSIAKDRAVELNRRAEEITGSKFETLSRRTVRDAENKARAACGLEVL